MPLYEYYCSNCNRILEIEQKITDDPLTQCPECGSTAFKRLISKTFFVLKGGGWYADGYTKSSSSSKKEGPGEKTKEGSEKNRNRKQVDT